MSNVLQTTTVFERNLNAYINKSRHIINQGGARSSKTYSILQLLYTIASASKKPLLISIVSESLPHLRRGAIRDFKSFLQDTGEWDDNAWSKSDFTYKKNKSTIEFFSCDIPGKVHGPARDILFINECNRISYDTAQQLAIRTRKVCFYDFNPVSEFWVHTEMQGREDAKYIKSTYKDNPYLDENIVKELEHAGSRNENFKRVYLDGEIGQLEGCVFDNWSIGEFNDDLQYAFGQDYGFSNDPTTLIKCAIDEKRKQIYLKECFYKTKLSTEQIYELNKLHAGQGMIIGDSAEPRLIEELFKKGLTIYPCEKGQGSISSGILKMLEYELIIDPSSNNLQKELKNYIWLDKGSKLVIDDYNHCIDAARYVIKRLSGNHFFAI